MPRSSPRHLLDALADHLPLALFSTDDRQRCTYMNAAAEKLTGYSFEEVTTRGESLHEILHPSRPDGRPYPLAECAVHGALGAGRRQGQDVFVRRDGSLCPVVFTASPVLLGDAAEGLAIEASEARDERGLAEALRERDERYRFLTETIPVQIWTALPDGNLDYVTEQTARLFGLTSERLLREGWQNVVHPDDLPLAVDRWVRSLSTGETYEVEFRLKLRDGTYACHLARAVAQRDAGGQIVRWFGTNTNIEEQREEKRRITALLDEVAKQAAESERALSAMRSSKEAADARVGELEAMLRRP